MKLDPDELITHISLQMRLEVIPKNRILFRIGNLFIKKGDRGEKFYLILKGEVEVLVPKEVKMEMSLDEYVNYINSLKKYNEVDLLYKCLVFNKLTFIIPEEMIFVNPSNHRKTRKESIKRINSLKKFASLSKEIQDFLLDIDDDEKVNLELKVNLNEYLEDLRPKVSLKPNGERKSLRIFQYMHILQLKTGDAFGEVALSNSNQKRYFEQLFQELPLFLLRQIPI